MNACFVGGSGLKKATTPKDPIDLEAIQTLYTDAFANICFTDPTFPQMCFSASYLNLLFTQ